MKAAMAILLAVKAVFIGFDLAMARRVRRQRDRWRDVGHDAKVEDEEVRSYGPGFRAG